LKQMIEEDLRFTLLVAGDVLLAPSEEIAKVSRTIWIKAGVCHVEWP